MHVSGQSLLLRSSQPAKAAIKTIELYQSSIVEDIEDPYTPTNLCLLIGQMVS